MSIEKEIPVYRFEDKTFKISLKDSNGAAIDLSVGYDNIVIFIYNADKTILEKYSSVTTAGWQDIGIALQNLGIVTILLDSETNADAALGKKYIEVLVRKTDANVPDNKYDTIAEKYLFTLKDSRSSEVTLP